MNKIKFKIYFSNDSNITLSCGNTLEACVKGMAYAFDKSLPPIIKKITNMDTNSSITNIRVNYSPML